MRFCRRIALALAISVAALLGGLPGLWTGEEATARPTDLLALSPSICIALLMDGTIPLDCYTMHIPYSLQSVAALAAPDSDLPLEPDDFAEIDLEANQMHNKDGQLFILAFVNDDEPVTFETSAGMFDRTSLWGDEDDEWVCDTEDEDCDDDGVAGDGVAVAWLWPCESGNPAAPARTCFERSEPGPGTVTVQQGRRTMSLDFAIVGEPKDVELVVVENTIQTGLDVDSCPMEDTAEGFAEALGLPEKTVILARALDSEDNEVTGAFIDWKTDDRDKGVTADSLTPTLDLGDLGVGTAIVLCGTDETGSVAVTGRIVPLTARLDGSLCYGDVKCPFELDPSAQPDHKSVELTVVGPPANLKVAAEPARLLCDGTTGSTVSTTVTDAESVAVADGNEVRFDVRAVGAASPITVKTIDGTAVSTVTPFSGVLQGVPVVVTAGDVQESVLIACEEAMPPPASATSLPLPPPAMSSPPVGDIMPPATGSGGQGNAFSRR